MIHFSRATRNSRLSALLLLLCCLPARAQEGEAPANQSDAPIPAPAAATPAEDAPKIGLTVGADLFYGVSNSPGARHFRDGFWIGSAPTFPSNLYGIYNGKDGTLAKIAVSVGKLYNGSADNFDQPIEAYISKNYGGLQLTAGKFYVPFELGEWEYESEFGVQAVRDWGKNGSLTAAVMLNHTRDTPNGYVRYARTAGIATFGVSLGAGRGFSFDTDHNEGAALDLTLEKGPLSFESAALIARQRGVDSRFGFAFARLNYEVNPRTQLYIARHSWSDRLDQQGNGHFSTVGAVFHLNQNLSVESAVSRSGELDKNIRWIQLHYIVEH